MKKVVTLFLAMVLCGSFPAIAQETRPHARDIKHDRETAAQLKALAEQLKVQQQQIQHLQEQVQQRDQQWQQMQQQLQQAQNNAAVLERKLAESAAVPSRPHPTNLGMVATTSPMVPSVAAEPRVPQNQTLTEPEKVPPPSDSIVLKNGKIRIGAVAYADWAIYHQTGFGPAFLDTPNIYPGPGNDGYNSFDVTRTYVNFLFSPTDWVTFRITPDIYRNIGSPAAQKLGNTSGVSSTPNGSLDLRLKYGYAEFTKIFSGAFKDDNFRAGQQTNPLVDWEEGLYGYRFTSMVPWNFISLSSTYTGLSLNGPIKGKNGKQYLDYQIGVFNNSNFHGFEVAETKTAMARLSLYPMGASSKYQGLGFTGFLDYGYNNASPDTNSQTPVVRTAALVHYQSPHDGGQIAFEYDYGRNAFSTGNMFGGSAPLDLLGLGATNYAGMTNLAKAILAGRSTKQRGYDVFGHLNFGKSNWAVFGLYQFFQPNTNIPEDPLDFHRVAAGLSYRLNKNVRVAFGPQDVVYKHSQFTYPATALSTWNPALATANPAGIPNAVPPSVKSLFLDMEFSF